jgi:hypothetical protein
MDRVLLLKNDRFTGYSQLLLKYFMVQGIAHGQSLALLSMDMHKPEEMLTQLPGLVHGKAESKEDDQEEFIPQLSATTGRTMGTLRQPVARDTTTGKDMAIAWRYKSMPQFSSALTSDFRGPNSKEASL